MFFPIDPLKQDEVSQEFLRIIGADPQLARELALQEIYRQWPFTANVPAPAPAPAFTPPAAAPATAPAQQKPTYRQQLEQALQQIPPFQAPPAPQPIPAPPAIPMPPKPEPVQLPTPPMPPEPPAQWRPADFLPGLVAAMFNQDALQYIAPAIEQGLQQREQRAMNRYERAMANALREWQTRMQEAQLNQQAQQQWQQQAYQAQLQNQQAQYQAQLQNIQQQNQYAQQRWAAEQDYNQWQYGQKMGAVGKLAEQEAREEEKQMQRELQEQLRTDQLAMQSFNILMGYVSKPTLSAAERQSALGLADSLAQQFPRFAPMFTGMKASIQAKPSVPEQRLSIEAEKARASIAQGQQRLAQGWARISQAQQRMAKGESRQAIQDLKDARSWLGRLDDDVRATRAQLNATRTDPLTLKTVPVISDPEQRQKLQEDLARLERQRDEAFNRVLELEGKLVPKPQPQQQQKNPQQKNPQQKNPQNPPPPPTVPPPPGYTYVFNKSTGRWQVEKVK